MNDLGTFTVDSVNGAPMTLFDAAKWCCVGDHYDPFRKAGSPGYSHEFRFYVGVSSPDQIHPHYVLEIKRTSNACPVRQIATSHDSVRAALGQLSEYDPRCNLPEQLVNDNVSLQQFRIRAAEFRSEIESIDSSGIAPVRQTLE